MKSLKIPRKIFLSREKKCNCRISILNSKVAVNMNWRTCRDRVKNKLCRLLSPSLKCRDQIILRSLNCIWHPIPIKFLSPQICSNPDLTCTRSMRNTLVVASARVPFKSDLDALLSVKMLRIQLMAHSMNSEVVGTNSPPLIRKKSPIYKKHKYL